MILNAVDLEAVEIVVRREIDKRLRIPLKSTYPRTQPCTSRILPFPLGALGRVVLERTCAGISLEIQGARV